MSLWVISGVTIVPLLALLASGTYVAISLATAAFFGFYFLIGGRFPQTIGLASFNLTNSFILTAIPLFIFMGEVIVRSGFSARLYRGISLWSQFVPGSLLHSNIGACSIFAAISGSSVATAAAIGTIALPELESRGYDRKISAGSLAAGGTLGPLIPPSISFIIYGVITETSVPRLFLAGAIPGLMLAGMFMTYIGVRVKLNPSLAPIEERNTWSERIWGSIQIWPIVLLIILVLGGIYLGLTTPTEAAALGSVGALGLAIAYRRLDWPTLRDSLREATRATGFIMFIIVGALLLGVVLAKLQVPQMLADAVLAAPLTPLMVLVALYGVYFILGMFFDGVSMMIITLPVIFPLILALGYDPIWFGVALTVILEVGLLTPPVGLNLYVIHGISKHRPFSEVVIGSAPFFVVMLVALALLTAFPQLALWLPNQAFGAIAEIAPLGTVG